MKKKKILKSISETFLAMRLRFPRITWRRCVCRSGSLNYPRRTGSVAPGGDIGDGEQVRRSKGREDQKEERGEKIGLEEFLSKVRRTCNRGKIGYKNKYDTQPLSRLPIPLTSISIFHLPHSFSCAFFQSFLPFLLFLFFHSLNSFIISLHVSFAC